MLRGLQSCDLNESAVHVTLKETTCFSSAACAIDEHSTFDVAVMTTASERCDISSRAAEAIEFEDPLSDVGTRRSKSLICRPKSAADRSVSASASVTPE
jgi:hypothetical protein